VGGAEFLVPKNCPRPFRGSEYYYFYSQCWSVVCNGGDDVNKISTFVVVVAVVVVVVIVVVVGPSSSITDEHLINISKLSVNVDFLQIVDDILCDCGRPTTS